MDVVNLFGSPLAYNLFYISVFTSCALILYKISLWPLASLLVVTFSIMASHDVSQLVIVKTLMLFTISLKCLFSFKDYNYSRAMALAGINIYILAFYFFFSLLLDREIELALISFWVMLQPFMFYLVVIFTRLSFYDLWDSTLGLFFLTLMSLSFTIFTEERVVFGSAVFTGYASHLLVLICAVALFTNKNKGSQFIILCVLCIAFIDVYTSGNRRFILPAMFVVAVLIYYLSKTKYSLLLSIPFISIIAFALMYFAFGGYSLDGEISLMRTTGYRGAERAVMYESILNGKLFFGNGFGVMQKGEVVGTKGWFSVGPVGHSLWVSILYNVGVIGATFYILSLGYLIYEAINKVKLKENMPALIIFSFLVGWLFAANFDTPRDGHWLIGLGAGLLYNLNRSTKCHY